ncbi:MAG TPA: helix-turn-helix transcriptional regulator [Pseudolabrys sp.]|nr:helix-turn-helix transcriptional regulator [Pseudolabrys sp.]
MWRDFYCRTVMKLDIEPLNGVPLEYSLLARDLPGVRVMSTASSPVRITRTREFLADGNVDFVLIINQTGQTTASARGREATLQEGDAILVSASETKVVDRHTYGGALSFRIPRSILSSMVTYVDDAVMQVIPHDTDALKLLAGYAAPLFNDIALATSEFRRTAANHLHDLVALAIGQTRDGLINARAIPAARLRMAKSYIIENCSRRDLSVGAVAAHLGLTPRNLQRLFESENTTFSEFLLSQRLNRAYRMLTEPRLAQSPVGTIAYDAGFGDLSYFNRSFKRRYGMTPRDVRNGGAAQPLESRTADKKLSAPV